MCYGISCAKSFVKKTGLVIQEEHLHFNVTVFKLKQEDSVFKSKKFVFLCEK